jgi:hypothetical protein
MEFAFPIRRMNCFELMTPTFEKGSESWILDLSILEWTSLDILVRSFPPKVRKLFLAHSVAMLKTGKDAGDDLPERLVQTRR